MSRHQNQRGVITMGKIKDFVEKVFDDYRNKRITLKQLIVGLCAYEDSTYITKGYGLYLKMS
jgi:hypothetical protein